MSFYFWFGNLLQSLRRQLKVLRIQTSPIQAICVEQDLAAIGDACEKNGRISEGDYEGNTAKNGNDDVRVNPANNAPPGQN